MFPMSDSSFTRVSRVKSTSGSSAMRVTESAEPQSTYTDSFGTTKTIQLRQDMQLQKFFAPFSGWFLSPKFRYYLYVWSSNSSQGDPAQVVGAGT